VDDEVVNLTKLRVGETNDPDFAADTFYVCTNDRLSAKLKDSVLDQIKSVREAEAFPGSPNTFAMMADLIESCLTIDHIQRAKAGDVVERLDSIQRCFKA